MDEAREASERMIHLTTQENVCVCLRQYSVRIFLGRRQGIQMGWRITLWQATVIFRKPWVIFPHKDTVWCHGYAMQVFKLCLLEQKSSSNSNYKKIRIPMWQRAANSSVHIICFVVVSISAPPLIHVRLYYCEKWISNVYTHTLGSIFCDSPVTLF